jgi:hypothetical protein
MSEESSTGRVAEKPPALYRLTRYSVVWIVAAALLIPYEVIMIAQGRQGGPLTHVVKWCYGEPHTLRWWLLGFSNSGFLLWMIPHFLLDTWGLRSLIALVLLGLLIGAAGYALTQS